MTSSKEPIQGLKAVPGTLGYRFWKKMTQEDIDDRKQRYFSEGWSLLDSPGRLSFISGDLRWVRSYDLQTSQLLAMSADWCRNHKMLLEYDEQEKVSAEEVRMPEEEQNKVRLLSGSTPELDTEETRKGEG